MSAKTAIIVSASRTHDGRSDMLRLLDTHVRLPDRNLPNFRKRGRLVVESSDSVLDKQIKRRWQRLFRGLAGRLLR